MKKTIVLILFPFFLAGCTQATGHKGPRIYQTEPRPGKIQSGIKVLVDDNSCGPGKIKQVTGGSKRLGLDRKYACISKPSQEPDKSI
ncbi:hypothetical protein OE766_10130 [Pararhizobium sp. YC-54]|uniref:DUF6719 family protein n=1 Tax=Pararhizobium sp. YC-54 TaxID=2986920 RepID=UPI0021F6FCB5|nr:DUF6719 family protein [Pararhizobium sp. YC-54]MCV9998606.1 hypothetical protein [Pararhizobium sp. YC-54]